MKEIENEQRRFRHIYGRQMGPTLVHESTSQSPTKACNHAPSHRADTQMSIMYKRSSVTIKAPIKCMTTENLKEFIKANVLLVWPTTINKSRLVTSHITRRPKLATRCASKNTSCPQHIQAHLNLDGFGLAL